MPLGCPRRAAGGVRRARLGALLVSLSAPCAARMACPLVPASGLNAKAVQYCCVTRFYAGRIQAGGFGLAFDHRRAQEGPVTL